MEWEELEKKYGVRKKRTSKFLYLILILIGFGIVYFYFSSNPLAIFKCPSSCDDENACTYDWCNATSNHNCVYSELSGSQSDCTGPVETCKYYSCSDGACIIMNETNCCGNGVCESGENYITCPPDCTLTNKESCEAQGGRWSRHYLLPGESCILPTSDAGDPCTDSIQCESACVAPGNCYGWNPIPGGCYSFVENGEIQPELCID